MDPEAEVIKAFNLDVPSYDVQKLVCGQVYENEDVYFKNISKGLDLKPYDLDSLKRILKEEQVGLICFYPESFKVLKTLKEREFKLGLVSNSWPYGVEKLQSKLSGFFNSMILSHETGLLKPDTAMFKRCLEEIGVKPMEALIVGDSVEDDILPGESIGMKEILLDRKNQYSDKSDTITDLYGLLDKIELLR